ncbi:PEP-CTERM sorting domain-containing protein [Alkalimonas amylolytica]|uniref:PEP-CTERM protein-sorting domain-containing protein n=1 Tax=Alkalimonas amylolytica TaxID=152573 RepID=A0A1H4C9J8_ALKAM|nr:PEP-CTERM sorting domain-containing protein [Alkalimonas amylolytica]SEA57047.1 PEP-CTERM protein-sorting domain-containing protein [Alkalimonas amylolytica]
MKKLLLAVLVLGFVALFTAPSTQATPILSQDLLLIDNNGIFQTIGSISVKVSESENFGDFNISTSWFAFELFGVQLIQDLDFDFFEVAFNPLNLFEGFQFLSFQVEDINTGDFFVGFFESGFGFFEDANGDFFDMTLGNVTVPAPATLALMLLALFGLMLRRRA